ncbi:hypothetical protein ACFQOZ_20125 [Comamonas endophytica]|uniref:hypothetical protein n=1 Tax=Comamonas endophytica TaxID=2949090 RepID=UPI00361FB1F9
MQSSVPKNFTAPSAELIGRLLARLQVPFDAQSLAQAWAQPDVNAERARPTGWARCCARPA